MKIRTLSLENFTIKIRGSYNIFHGVCTLSDIQQEGTGRKLNINGNGSTIIADFIIPHRNF